MATLRVSDALTLDDAEHMRIVRNECRDYMTRNTAEIDRLRQTLWWRQLDRRTMFPLLFWIGPRAVGYGLVRVLDGKWWVTGGLIPDAREQKLGRELFEALFERVGGTEIWLEVRSTNTRARKLYTRLGFEIVEQAGEIVTMKRAKHWTAPEAQAEPSVAAQPDAHPGLADSTTQAILRRANAVLAQAHATDLGDGPTAPIRRVVAATINYDHPQRGMLAALHEQFETREFDFLQLGRDGLKLDGVNQRFYETVRDYHPDLVWLQVQDSEVIRAETLRRIRQDFPRTLIAHWTGDCRPFMQPYLASICKATHATFVSSVGQLPLFREHGAADAFYLQIGLDWDEDVLGLPVWEPKFRVPDVVFCGGYYPSQFPEGSAERIGAIRALQAAGVDVGIVGPGWPKVFPCVGQCSVKQQHHIWRRAKVALSINHYNHIERYYSDRQLISMASGTPVVCHYVPGLEQEFDNGEHCCWFSTPEEAVRLVKQLLADPERRKRIGEAGRARVIERHTWRARFQDVLPTWERLRGQLISRGA
jgi:GNAT superfamily N-acetyltransferase